MQHQLPEWRLPPDVLGRQAREVPGPAEMEPVLEPVRVGFWWLLTTRVFVDTCRGQCFQTPNHQNRGV